MLIVSVKDFVKVSQDPETLFPKFLLYQIDDGRKRLVDLFGVIV